MSDTPFTRQAEASQHLDLAAFHLYYAGQERHEHPLPNYESKDATDMRRDAKYRAIGAHKRGDHDARLAVIERVAVILAVANGDIWPQCDNQIHRGLSVERVAVLGAMRRQRYRHQARLVTAEVARFYEIDQDIPAMLQVTVERAKQQQEADAKIVAAYRSRIGRGEVVAIGMVRE